MIVLRYVSEGALLQRWEAYGFIVLVVFPPSQAQGHLVFYFFCRYRRLLRTMCGAWWCAPLTRPRVETLAMDRMTRSHRRPLWRDVGQL